MIDPSRPVPGHAPVPFHIAVKPKKFAAGAEGDVVGVARAGGEKFAVPAILIHAHDKSARRVQSGAKTVAVIRPRQQLVVNHENHRRLTIPRKA